MQDLLPGMTFDDPSVHETRAVMTARCYGLPDALPILERLRTADTPRPSVARVSLYLGDITGARRAVEDWENDGTWDPDEAQEVLTLCGLLDSDGGQGRDLLDARLARLRCPCDLQVFGRVIIPMLLLRYGDRPGAARVLAELRDVAEQYLQALDTDPPSLLDAYVQQDKVIDADTQDYVRGLLTVADVLQRGVDGDAASEIAALISRAPTGPLAAALQVLLSRLPTLR